MSILLGPPLQARTVPLAEAAPHAPTIEHRAPAGARLVGDLQPHVPAPLARHSHDSRAFHHGARTRAVPPGFPDLTPEQAEALEARSASLVTYTYAQLNAMSFPTLVSTLRSIAWSDIQGLFDYSEDARVFWSNSARVQAIYDGLRDSGSTFTATDAKGIPTLGEVIRAGWYLAFYNAPLASLDTWTEHSKALPALNAIVANPNFRWGTAQQISVIDEVGYVMGNGITSVELLNTLAAGVMRTFNDNAATWMTDTGSLGSARRNAYYRLGYGPQYAIVSYYLYRNPTVTAAPFYNTIGAYYEELGRTAKFGQTNPTYTWLINNAVWWLGEFAPVVPNARPKRLLTDVYNVYGAWTYPSAQAIEIIANDMGGVDADGRTWVWSNVRNQLIATFLPRTYTFDGGSAVYITGDRVDPLKVQRLYWATKELNSQVARALDNDQPLQTPAADDKLTAVIYNDPDEYEFNLLINGLSTDNGGIYIESQGTFYTWERTPQQSIYTLEELFRHEYTHYLQGRFMVPGLWGTGPIYANERLTWLEEGMAEFFAGSTRNAGVRNRRSLVQNLANDGSGNWYSVSQVLGASYNSGFTFYRYGFALWSHMYFNRPDLMFQFADILRAGNVAGYDSLIAQLKADSAFNTAYRAHIQNMVDNVGSTTDPETSPDYLAFIPATSEAALYAQISSTAGLSATSTGTTTSAEHRLFRLRGTYTGGASTNETADWRAANTSANGWLNSLATGTWAGYKTFNAQFTGYRRDASNRYVYDVTFTGKLDSTAGNQPPVARPNGPYSAVAGSAIAFSSAGSSDPDGTISAYLWTFGDGTTSATANPSKAYATAGTYTVSLRVTDNQGAQTTASTTATVTSIGGGGITVETEPNNSAAQANGPVASGVNVTGAIVNTETDWFTFTLPGPRTVALTATLTGDTNATFVLVHESNLNAFLAWPTSSAGGVLSGSANVTQAGRYYVLLYRWTAGTSNYTLRATF
jgi:microbial collagenase